MSDKMTCFGCNSYTSGVLRAFEEGEPCPYCGLSAEAALEIESVRKSRADQALREKCEVAVKQRDQAVRELAWAKARLERLGRLLGDLVETVGSPLENEKSTW